MVETLKINWIYFWEEHNGKVKDFFMYLFAPLWLPPALLMALIFFILGENSEDEEIDRKWCKEHNFPYPDKAFIPHQAVNKMKREIKRAEKKKKKEAIRKRLKSNPKG